MEHRIGSVLTIWILSVMAMTSGEDTCTDKASCKSKTDKYSFQINCGCDESCIAVGDCCSDSDFSASRDKTLPSKPECVSMPFITSSSGVTIGSGNTIAIVRECPADFQDSYIRKRCHNLQKNLPYSITKVANDFTLFVPVLGKSSKVLFANIFCARCNGESKTSFLMIDFQSRKPLSIEKFLAIQDFTKLNAVFPRTRVTMFHPGYTPRPCRDNIAGCHRNWPSDETASRCKEGATSYVYNSAVSVYKNKYCALCNYLAEANITCEDPRSYIGTGHKIILYPYSLLFDLNTAQITSRRLTEQAEEDSVVHLKQEECQQHEVFDLFRRKCVALYCMEKNSGCKEASELPDEIEESNDYRSMENVSETEHPCSTKLSLLHKMHKTGYLSSAAPHAILCTASNDSLNGSPNALALDQVPKTSLGYPATYLTVVCNALSIAGLAAHLAVYGTFQSLRNTPGKCLMCLSFCLMTTQLLFTLAMGQTAVKVLCFAIALTMHYSSLAYFLWMAVLSFDIWHTFHLHARSTAGASRENERTFKKYCVFAFGLSVLGVTVSAVMDSFDISIRPHYADHQCWFGQQEGLLLYFDVPVAIIIVVNTTFLLLTIRNIMNVSRNTEVARSQSSRKEKHRFFLYVKLSLVMGLTYVTAFVALVSKRPEMWYVFIIFNSLQGVWIFLSFVCTKKVFQLICESCGDRIGLRRLSIRNSRSKASCSTTKQTALNDSATLQETDKLTISKEEEIGKR